MDTDSSPVEPLPRAPLPSYPSPEGTGHQSSSSGALHSGNTSFGTCVLAALVWFGVFIGLILLTVGMPASGEGLGFLIGTLAFPWLFGALATWLFLRRKQTRFWTPLLVSLPCFVIVWFVFGAMRVIGRG